MGKIFSIDNDIKQVITDVLDDFLVDNADGGLGKKCLLYYPSKKVPCNNCIYDSITNRSSNRPRDGSPIPFVPGTTCPLCSGKGLKEQEITEEIVLKCNWEPKKFTRMPSSANVNAAPYSLVETKGFLSDLPKILKAQYILINSPISPIIRQNFVLIGEPGDPGNIIQGRYFIAVWERKK